MTLENSSLVNDLFFISIIYVRILAIIILILNNYYGGWIAVNVWNNSSSKSMIYVRILAILLNHYCCGWIDINLNQLLFKIYDLCKNPCYSSESLLLWMNSSQCVNQLFCTCWESYNHWIAHFCYFNMIVMIHLLLKPVSYLVSLFMLMILPYQPLLNLLWMCILV